MISRALNVDEAHAIDETLLTDIYAETVDLPEDCESAAFTRRRDGLYVVRAEGIKGATGALTAISLEIAVAFCAYCVWHFWHMLR